MKKRLLSLVLAASMILGSVNVVFANEADASVDSEVVAEEETVTPSDDVESDAAVIPVALSDETYGINWATTSPWEATVYGDCGGQTRIDNLGNPDWSEYKKDADGNTVYTYDVVEDGNSVNLRMGSPNPSDSTAPIDSQGKIASGTEGRVMYYQTLTADDDFTISATAHVNAIANNNNQVSFGAVVIDDITPGVYQQNTPADSVNAGVRQMNNGLADITTMEYGFVRQSGVLTEGFKPEAGTSLTVPDAGDDIKISLKKSGTTYTIKFGNESVTYDGSELSMTDDIYVGFYVTRCADITFNNVRLSIVGDPVELPDWEKNGNGSNAWSSPNWLGRATVTASPDNTNPTDITFDLNDGSGKFSSSEDSYSYYAVQAPAGEDFKLSTTIDEININPSSNIQQAAAGIMLFDEHYYKEGSDGGNAPEGVKGAASGKSLFIGVGYMSSSSAGYQLYYRINNGSTVKTASLSDTILGTQGSTVGPFNVTLVKSGDILKIKIDDNEAVDVDIEGLFENNQYIGYGIARQGHIKVSNNDLFVGTKKVTSLEVATPPTKTAYYSTEKFDATGLTLFATYKDGTTAIIDNPDDYSLVGFDDATGKYFTTPGDRIVKAQIGSVAVEIPVNVRPRKVTNINVDYAPAYDTYYEGGKFNTTGLQVTASFEDGTSKKLTSSQYVLKIGDTVLTDSTTITSDIVGEDLPVVVTYTDTDETIDPNNMSDAFYVTITPGQLTAIKILTRSFNTSYYVGQNIYEGTEEVGNVHVPGLNVYGVYKDSNGNENFQYISPTFYEVVDAETGEPVETFTTTFTDRVIKVQLKENPSLYDTYTINVIEPVPMSVDILSYPRLTFAQDEAFDTEGLEFAILSTDRVDTVLCADAFFFKNDTEYYKVYNVDADGHAKGDVVTLDEADVLNADFYIDLTDYDSSKVGTTHVSFVVNSKYGAAGGAKVWDITIVEKAEYVWKATLFGASSLGVKEEDPSSYINVHYVDGSSALTNEDVHQVVPELMEDGKLADIDSVDVVSWAGSGKISGDQDGIAYYYTKLNAQNNFSLSADITVNRYVFEVDDLTADQKAKYDSYIASGDSEEIALDKLRSGQEAFGIMARDVIPFAGGVDENGEYLGGATNLMTPYPDEAIQKTYEFTRADGTTVSYETPVDLYEAFMGNITVTDAAGKTYRVSRANVETTFASNIVIAGGCTDSTWPTDPSSSTYVKKTLMNRINIMSRTGVTNPNGAGTRVGIYSTTSKLPQTGEKYNVKLTKINTGYMITTYDYQTGNTVTKYSFETVDDTEDLLEIQDSDNLYVGFFASRYADMTVENIELYESNPETDPIITATVNEAVSPKVTVNSSYYTTTADYTLRLKSNSTSGMTGGVTNISMNGKTIEKDTIVGNKEKSFDIELVPNSVNRFSVVYYPNTADNFLSYDPVILRFTVTHTYLADASKIYVSPTGTPAGDGSRENPINFETALGVVDFGGEIIMLDGTYYPTNTDLAKIDMPTTYSGLPGGKFKTLRAEEGARPIIDLMGIFDGFECDADYWYFKGFEVCNSLDNETAFNLAGEHCVVEDCTFYNNGSTGFQISRINGSDATIYDWPSYNVVKHCESYNNCDPSKNNADGFSAKLTVGFGNVYEDCISHHNLDDGWDCYTKINTGAIGAVVLENCISYKQGYKLHEDGTEEDFNATSGGNGFKLGGEGIYVEHMLKDCIAFYNKASGIDTNNNPALIARNVILYDNYGYNLSLYTNTPNSLVDADGNIADADGKVYKFNYDFEGLVSAGTVSIDRISSINYEIDYANVSANPLLSESNYLKAAPYTVFLDSEDPLRESQSAYYKMDSENSAGQILDVNTFFKSVNAEDSYGTLQRYSRNEDGSFDHGDFLARVTPYVHNAEDIVTLPDYYGGNGGVGLGTGVEITEATTTEVTTKVTSTSGSGAGVGGGGGSSKVSQYEPKTTTTTVSSAVEDATETTTEAPVLSASIAVTVGSNNITINENEVAMDVAPYIQSASNSTMVPLRFVAIAIAGGNVEDADNSDLIAWDAVAKTATITAGSNTIVFTAGAGTYVANGNTLNISNQAVAEIVDGRMFVPFRTIGEALGADVSWDAATKTAMYN